MRNKVILVVIGVSLILSGCADRNIMSSSDAESDLIQAAEGLETTTDDKIKSTSDPLSSDILRVDDTIDKYSEVFDLYFKHGYIKTLNEDFFYKGTHIAGLSGDNDKEYMCYTVSYDNNGVSKNFVIPSQEISEMWLNEILIYLVNQNTEDLIKQAVPKIKGLKVLKVNLDGLTRDINILNNPYDIDFNEFDLNRVSTMGYPIVIEVKVSKPEILVNYKEQLSKALKDYNITVIVEEY